MITEFYVQSCTGQKLYAKKWIDENRQEYKGVIQLVHGMEEHIGRYEEFANILAREGYIVVGHDHLGHGNSVKNNEDFGYFGRYNGWSNLVEDVHIIQNKISEEYNNLPYIIFAHSMGSLVVRTYLTKYKDNIKGAILSGTSGQKSKLILGQILIKFMIVFKGEKYRSKLVEYLVTGSFNKKFKPNRTNADWTTRNNDVIDKYKDDPKCGINFTLRGYLDLLKGTHYLSKQKNVDKTLDIPILLISGDKDPVGQNGKGVIRVERMLKKANLKNITVRFFKDARHELINEINKDEVYYVIFNWIKNNI